MKGTRWCHKTLNDRFIVYHAKTKTFMFQTKQWNPYFGGKVEKDNISDGVFSRHCSIKNVRFETQENGNCKIKLYVESHMKDDELSFISQEPDYCIWINLLGETGKQCYSLTDGEKTFLKLVLEVVNNSYGEMRIRNPKWEEDRSQYKWKFWRKEFWTNKSLERDEHTKYEGVYYDMCRKQDNKYYPCRILYDNGKGEVHIEWSNAERETVD